MRHVADHTVMNMLYRFGGVSRHVVRTYPETSRGIARAAMSDPLFPLTEHGAEATVCLLVATAWHCSRLQPYLRVGPRLGLYQIRPPSYPRIQADLLFRPQNASLIAIDLIRTSLLTMKEHLWEERLGWFLDLGNVSGSIIPNTPQPMAIGRSLGIMKLAKTLYDKRFSEGTRLVDVIASENVSPVVKPLLSPPKPERKERKTPLLREAPT